jgi:transcriptional regulator with XRE-family HTH domain
MIKELMMLAYNRPFPTRLRYLLDETKTSQGKLAKAIEVSQQAVGKWANGISEPDMSYFKAIAEYFGVSYEYLYGDSKSKKRENLLIADELGLFDGAVEKLREWAKDTPEPEKADETATVDTNIDTANEEVFEDLSDESTRYVPNNKVDFDSDEDSVAAKIKSELTSSVILSYMLEHKGFELFLERTRQCLCERVDYLHHEQEVYEELANIETSGFAIYDDEEADYHARQVGKRLINAGDLSHFYRKLAVEALEVALNDLHDECALGYAEVCEKIEFPSKNDEDRG